MDQAEQVGPTPPKKRRCSRLIVASMMVLFAGMAWWNWPRGDARFAGKWRAVLANQATEIYTISGDGGFHREWVGGPTAPFESTYWVNGDAFYIGAKPYTWFNSALKNRYGLAKSIFNAVWALTTRRIEGRYRFLFRNADEIVLTDERGYSRILYRIRE